MSLFKKTPKFSVEWSHGEPTELSEVLTTNVYADGWSRIIASAAAITRKIISPTNVRWYAPRGCKVKITAGRGGLDVSGYAVSIPCCLLEFYRRHYPGCILIRENPNEFLPRKLKPGEDITFDFTGPIFDVQVPGGVQCK